MHPIETLMDEHRLMEQALNSLCMLASTTADDAADRREALGEFVAFFRTFDELHHLQEENMLFESMIDNGFPREEGPLAVMVHEHTICRRLVATMADLAHRTAPWSEQDHATLDATATEYALFLKAHILKEDNVLYPMSRRVMPDAEWVRLEGSFEEMARDWEDAGRIQEFQERFRLLRRAWPAEDGPTPAGGCGLR